MAKAGMDFSALVRAIRAANVHFAARAARAVNLSLTLRNWFIGLYISEYELQGADRAKYGDRLLEALWAELQRSNVSNVGRRQLYNSLAFYRAYPQLARAVPAQSRTLLPPAAESAEKVRSVTALSAIDPEILVNRLSYTHLELLLGVKDEPKRRFYEMECVRGSWSVRELRRQIVTLAFERTALSTDKARLLEQIRQGAEADSPALVIRDPYVFEFLGIKPAEVRGESQLEDALLDTVQAFLLELGRGFCFEARQRRILIGDEHFFVETRRSACCYAPARTRR